LQNCPLKQFLVSLDTDFPLFLEKSFLTLSLSSVPVSNLSELKIIRPIISLSLDSSLMQ